MTVTVLKKKPGACLITAGSPSRGGKERERRDDRYARPTQDGKRNGRSNMGSARQSKEEFPSDTTERRSGRQRGK